MPIFDVSRIVTHTDHVWERNGRRYQNIKSMVDWLSEHVGEYYGPGDDPARDDESNNKQGTAVLYIGSGWQLERDWKGDPDGYVEVWWKVDITDETKATHFALTWIK